MQEQNTMVDKPSQEIIFRVEEIVQLNSTTNAKLQQISAFLEEAVTVFDWVGFYLVDPEAEKELILGPYVGEETEHVRIPFGTGICGQAAATNKTFVVADVARESNYLACSIDVKSEIVVPVKKEGEFVAELDIDSHTKDGITKEHQEMLEEICNIIAVIF